MLVMLGPVALVSGLAAMLAASHLRDWYEALGVLLIGISGTTLLCLYFLRPPTYPPDPPLFRTKDGVRRVQQLWRKWRPPQ